MSPPDMGQQAHATPSCEATKLDNQKSTATKPTVTASAPSSSADKQMTANITVSESSPVVATEQIKISKDNHTDGLSVSTSEKRDDSNMPSRVMSSSSTSPISFFHSLPTSMIKDVTTETGELSPPTNEVLLHDVSVVEDIDIEARLFSESSSPAIIKRVCQSLVPGWNMLRAEADIKVSQIMAGLTNQLFKVELKKNTKSDDQETHDRNKLIDGMNISRVLFRIYGRDVSDLYDTNFEVAVFQALSNVGIAPKLVERFPGGRIEEWILGPALLTKDMCKPPILCGVAAILGRFHKLNQNCPELMQIAKGEACVWNMMDRWRTKAMSIYETSRNVVHNLYDPNHLDKPCLERTESEMSDVTAITYKRAGTMTNLRGQTAAAKLKFMAQLEECGLHEMVEESSKLKDLLFNPSYVVPDDTLDVCFCHNDVQENNILVTTASLRLIDFEYADLNYPAYDIGNFLWESTCDYCHPDFPFYSLKDTVSGYPNDEVVRLFGAVYLSERRGAMILPSDPCLDSFVDNVKRFVLTSHLVWGFWSVIRANQAPTVNEFDFMGYARDRFNGYRTWKKHLTSLGLFTPKLSHVEGGNKTH